MEVLAGIGLSAFDFNHQILAISRAAPLLPVNTDLVPGSLRLAGFDVSKIAGREF
jgi:hypothetical protein